VLAVFLAATAPAAYSHHWAESGEGGWHHKHMMHWIKRVDIPITITGTSSDSAKFTINKMAIEGKKGKVMVVTPDTPLSGSYNMSHDMAYISMGAMGMGHMGVEGMNIRVDSVNNSSIPVAGASAVLGLSDFRIECKGKDYTIATFSKMSVYLPDGSVKSYNLSKPVKVIKSRERKMAVWDAYPAFSKALGDALKGGATFPASASPLKMANYDTAVSGSVEQTIGEAKPMEATEAPPE